MNSTATGTARASTTFVFSDEELLDALSNIDEDTVDLSAFDKASTAAPVVSDGPFASSSVFSALDTSKLFTGPNKTIEAKPSGSPVDVDDTASTDSSSETGAVCERESVPSPTKKPSRKRRKHELDLMRELAATLESQLAELKKKHHRHDDEGADVFWKRVADQLLLDRQRATTENARLRDIFQDQSKVLKGVQRSLLKSPDLEKLGVVPSTDPPLDTTSSFDLYNRLFQDVATAYEGTDTVMEKAGIQTATDSSRRVNVDMRTDGGHSVMTMQVTESKEVPFSIGKMNDSVWHFLGNNSCGSDDDIFKRAFKARGDDVFGVCKIGCSLGLYTLKADVAVRRFFEGNRLTYVWECVGSCDNEPNPFSSFRLQEKGWVVFEPSPSDPLKKSIFRSCVHFNPQPLNPSQELGTAAKDIGLATEVALSVYEKTIGYMYETVVAELMGELSVS